MPAALTASGWSDVIALDGDGYFDPVTLEPINDADGPELVSMEHTAGFWVQGVDNVQTFGGGQQNSAGVDAATNQQHLNQAAAQAAAQVHVAGIPKSDWTQNQRVAYIDAFRAIVMANPESFTDATWQIASRINTSDLTAIDHSASGGVYFTDMIAGAAQSVAATLPAQAATSAITGILDAINGLGKTASSLSKFLPLVISVAAVAAIYLSVRSVGRDPGGQLKKSAGAVREILPY